LYIHFLTHYCPSLQNDFFPHCPRQVLREFLKIKNFSQHF
jgi:hypothetical protein